MIGPMWGLLGMIPTLSRGQVALEKLNPLGLALTRDVRKVAPSGRWFMAATAWSFQAVFAYESQGRMNVLQSGAAGRVDSFRGTGLHHRGNGGGKSTLVKVLTGLYLPQQGQVKLNGDAIVPTTQDWYRQHFAVVFGLLSLQKVARLDPSLVATQADGWLKTSVSITRSAFRTGNIPRSTSCREQRKRLALVTAMLEDRPFYVLMNGLPIRILNTKEVFLRGVAAGAAGARKGRDRRDA